METNDYVIISKDGELVRLSTGMSNRGAYENLLRISREESSLIIFSKYGLRENGYACVIDVFDTIHEMPYSEVREKVDGLIRKLTGREQ